MIKINLIPYRAARKKENIRQQISIFVLFFIFLAMGLSYYHIHLAGEISQRNEVLKATQKNLKSYEAKVKEVDKIKSKLEVLDKKLDIMANLNKGREKPVKLLKTLTDLTVKNRMWLTSMQEAGNRISLSGIAMDNNTVAMFMSRIEKNDFFANVELSDLVQVDRKGLKLKQFNLLCTKAA